jgi:hypothetical protein
MKKAICQASTTASLYSFNLMGDCHLSKKSLNRASSIQVLTTTVKGRAKINPKRQKSSSVG